MIKVLPEKRPAEAVTVTFRFARELPAGVSLEPGATVMLAVRKGTDVSPQAMLAGAPAVAGTDVLARVMGGMDGVQYLVSCIAETSNGDRLQLDAILPVANAR